MTENIRMPIILLERLKEDDFKSPKFGNNSTCPTKKSLTTNDNKIKMGQIVQSSDTADSTKLTKQKTKRTSNEEDLEELPLITETFSLLPHRETKQRPTRPKPESMVHVKEVPCYDRTTNTWSIKRALEEESKGTTTMNSTSVTKGKRTKNFNLNEESKVSERIPNNWELSASDSDKDEEDEPILTYETSEIKSTCPHVHPGKTHRGDFKGDLFMGHMYYCPEKKFPPNPMHSSEFNKHFNECQYCQHRRGRSFLSK